jgi:2'-hydroxyisoflavone reductase
VRRYAGAAPGDSVLAPGDAATPAQFIDARDAAAWMLRQAEQGHVGTFNLSGPEEPLTMQGLLEAARTALGNPAPLVWVDEAFLLAQGVGPWMELPLWLPRAQGGLLQVDITRALDTGLACRPLAQTVMDTAAWAACAPPAPADAPPRPAVGLAPEREAALLAAWRAR